MKRLVSLGVAIAALAFGAAGAASSQSDRAVERSGNVFHVRVCAQPGNAQTARCHAHVVTDSNGRIIAHAGKPVASVSYNATQLRGAYNIIWDGSAPGSSSPTVAVVDAYGYARAEADLAVYRSTMGLPACTSQNGCFRKVDQTGGTNYPADNTGWAQETALDIQMVSAICPNCKILLVQAKSANFDDLAVAEDYAANNASVISNSYGANEGSFAPSYDSHYAHPGVAITVSSGDSGYGVEYPASSPNVTAVGGTSLRLTSGGAYSSESAWSGAGSGCSTQFAKPAWQNDACGNRMVADVSAVADPATGVQVYAPYTSSTSPAWLVFGGTSVAAPIIAGAYGAHGGTYTFGSDPYLNGGSLRDVSSGSNGRCRNAPAFYCNAVAGYDGPTGLGTPNGVSAF